MTIRKEGSQYCVITSRSKECFSSKKKAEERLRQIEFFKNQKMAEYKKKKRKEMAEDVLVNFGEALETFACCDKCANRKKVIPDNRGGLPLLDRKFAEDNSVKPANFLKANAKAGLAIRKRMPPSQRGGTAVGIARARDISNGKNLSLKTLKRMANFLSRHRGTKPKGKSGKELRESKWGQAILLWGGSPANPERAMNWARKQVERLEKK